MSLSRLTRRSRLLAVLAAAALGAGVATSLVSAPAGATEQRSAVAAPPTVTKVLVFVVENHSLDQMRASMPFVYSLATRYAYATNYTAVRHPSLPNYLAIAGGSTFGITDDLGPSSHRLHGASLFSQALAAHRTTKVYADSAPRNCALANYGRYAVRHNPWTYFVDSRPSCRRFDVPARALATDAAAGTLPNFGMVIPNLVHDAHDASLATADAWIATQIRRVQAGPDWNSGRLAIVVTADEDNRRQNNKVLTVVASKYQSQRVVTTALNHYSLTRFVDDVLGTRYLRKAATARSLTAAFGVSTRPRP